MSCFILRPLWCKRVRRATLPREGELPLNLQLYRRLRRCGESAGKVIRSWLAHGMVWMARWACEWGGARGSLVAGQPLNPRPIISNSRFTRPVMAPSTCSTHHLLTQDPYSNTAHGPCDTGQTSVVQDQTSTYPVTLPPHRTRGLCKGVIKRRSCSHPCLNPSTAPHPFPHPTQPQTPAAASRDPAATPLTWHMGHVGVVPCAWHWCSHWCRHAWWYAWLQGNE